MKDAGSQFSPAAILKASGRRFRNAATRQLDRAQGRDKPSDFGDHEPIPEEAVIKLAIEPDSSDVEEKE